MEGVSEAYHIPFRVRLLGQVDVPALCGALDSILSRHEVLRTTFVLIDGEPKQHITPSSQAHFTLSQHDLSGSGPMEPSWASLLERDATAPFNLESGPLIRGCLIQITPEEHVLQITMHHIVSDGWSMGIFTREFSALYTALHAGKPDPLPVLNLQYADYAQWQRSWMEGEILQQQAEYWKAALSDAPALLELPTDRPRPAQKDYAGQFAPFFLDEQLSTHLKTLGRRLGMTSYMVLLAGWAALLSRLSGQQDLVIGTPTANRTRMETENLIGFFVNTLALRLQVDRSITVGELLQQAKRQALAAQQHQDIPFEQVVELVRPTRSLAHSPVFQVMFAWQNNNSEALQLSQLQMSPVGTDTPYRVAKFDLTLSLRETERGIEGGLEYATSLFDPATVNRYLEYFRNLLQAMVSDETQLVHQIAILPDAERQQLLYDWNDTRTEFPNHTCIHQLFEAQVLKTPEATAVVFEEEQLSYGELNRRANRLAHYLRELGIGPDDRVALCVERSLEMVIGLMAVLKAGGAYVPLDPGYPQERLDWMLQDSMPVVLLTQSHLHHLFATHPATLPVLDLDTATAWQQHPQTNPSVNELTPHHLAYIIYTSGSTGLPKGVMVEHRSLVNRLIWMQHAYQLAPEDVVLQKTPSTFDVSVWELICPLLSGSTLILLLPNKHKDAIYLVEAVRQRKITTIHFVPSMLQGFLAIDDVERCTSLRHVVCSGEALPASLVKQFHTCFGSVSLHNLFGPTEATIDVTEWIALPQLVSA